MKMLLLTAANPNPPILFIIMIVDHNIQNATQPVEPDLRCLNMKYTKRRNTAVSQEAGQLPTNWKVAGLIPSPCMSKYP